MKEQLSAIKTSAESALEKALDLTELENLRVKYLGKKGELTSLMKGMGKLTPEERPVIGQLANEVRGFIEGILEEKSKALIKLAKDKKLASETIDVCLPGNRPEHGKKHPITTVLNDLKDIFIGMGFTIAEGPEVELDYYNFEGSLTTPPCTEGVNWIVFKKQENISKAQVKKFSKTLGFNNNRPIQKLNGREIKE